MTVRVNSLLVLRGVSFLGLLWGAADGSASGLLGGGTVSSLRSWSGVGDHVGVHGWGVCTHLSLPELSDVHLWNVVVVHLLIVQCWHEWVLLWNHILAYLTKIVHHRWHIAHMRNRLSQALRIDHRVELTLTCIQSVQSVSRTLSLILLLVPREVR